MHTVSEMLPDEFKSSTAESLSSRLGGCVVTLVGPIRTQNNSEVYRGRVATSPITEFALKRCLMPRTLLPDRDGARIQYAALEKLRESFSEANSPYQIPAPRFLDETSASFGMDWIEGVTITDLLHTPQALLRGSIWVNSAGRWLGHFHTAGPHATCRFNTEARASNIAKLLESPLPNSVFIAATHTLAKSRSRVSKLDVQRSWLHGDCKTDNIMIGDCRIYGIDISLVHEDAIEYDIAQFLNHLDLLVSGPKEFLLRPLKNKLELAFWLGYQEQGLNVSDDCLNWIRLYAALNLWRSTIRFKKPGIRTWIHNKTFANLVTRLANTL